CFNRDILKFISNDIDPFREGLEAFFVLVIGNENAGGNLAGGAVFLRAVDDGFDTQPRGGQRGHPPQLPAAQYAENFRFVLHPVFTARVTDFVCFFLYFSSLAAIFSSASARIDTASSAAFFAPAGPMASVP